MVQDNQSMESIKDAILKAYDKVLKETKFERLELLLGVKLNVLIPPMENKKDSFWYYNNDVLNVEFPNGKKLYLEATGSMKLAFEIDGEVFSGENALEEANRRKLNDNDLNEIASNDLFSLNNWFRIILCDINGETEEEDIAIVGDYDSGYQMLAELTPKYYNKFYS